MCCLMSYSSCEQSLVLRVSKKGSIGLVSKNPKNYFRAGRCQGRYVGVRAEVITKDMAKISIHKLYEIIVYRWVETFKTLRAKVG